MAVDFTVYERGLRVIVCKGPGSLSIEREAGDNVHVLEHEGLTYAHHQRELGANWADTIYIIDPGPVLVKTYTVKDSFFADFGVSAAEHTKVRDATLEAVGKVK